MFIAVEGGDGAGKSTQVKLLARYFEEKGREVVICREPGSTLLGERVREILLHQEDLKICRWSELFLFMAARSQLVTEVICPALSDGKVVLADRFLLSSMVYQGYAGELGVEEIREIGKYATGGLLPDLTFLLDISLQKAQERRQTQPDRMEKQGDLFHLRVREGFLAEAKKFPRKVVLLSAEHSVEEIHAQIISVVETLLRKRQTGETDV
ncbi:MAG: dTMP kinase [Planctomycetia bacterium]|nr:dTMP kinase [Planctomycetia bacterium]